MSRRNTFHSPRTKNAIAHNCRIRGVCVVQWQVVFDAVRGGPHRPSVAGGGDGYGRVFVVYKNESVYPEYSVTYTHAQTRPTVGDWVRLAPGCTTAGVLTGGKLGKIVKDDHDEKPCTSNRLQSTCGQRTLCTATAVDWFLITAHCFAL